MADIRIDLRMKATLKALDAGIPGLELDTRIECESLWCASYAVIMVEIIEPEGLHRRFFNSLAAHQAVEDMVREHFKAFRCITGRHHRALHTGDRILHFWPKGNGWDVEIEAYVYTARCRHCQRVLRSDAGKTRHEALCEKRDPLEQEAMKIQDAHKSRRGSRIRAEVL